MKFKCAKKELAGRIQIAKTAVPSRTTMAILEFIYIEVQNAAIRFFTNDEENGIDTVVNGEILEQGFIAVEAGVFSSIISSLPDSEITLTSDEDYRLIIECEKTKFTLPGRSGDDFPFPPEVEQVGGISISQGLFKKFISQTAFCVSSNEANKIMTGALIDINENMFSICALDGHRIAIRKTELSSDYVSKKAIVPGKSLRKVESILSDDETKIVDIYIADHYISFFIDDTKFTCRLIEGSFFDVSQMLSGDYETKIHLNRKKFLDGIAQAMSIASDADKKPIILGITDEEDMTLNSKNVLNFPGYEEKLETSRERSRMLDGVISGTGKINGIEVSIAAMEFSFMGGSMGSVVGERITRAMERGLKRKIPVVVVSSSGGARMQEGILSLMQMAKTSGAVKKLNEARIPFISVPVDPTTGGVTASFAMLGDVIITEPNAFIAFAGPRVIEQTVNQKLPKGFQRAEFLLEHGMVDIISERKDLKTTIYRVLEKLV